MAATDGRRGTCTYASLGIAVSPLAAISDITYLFSKTVISEPCKVKEKWTPVETVTAGGKC